MKKTSILFAGVLTFASVSTAFIANAATYTCYGTGCYNNGYYYNQPSLQVSCYSSLLSATVGQSVNWYSSVSGGIGNYQYYWTGDEGLRAYGSSVYQNYYYSGTKEAKLTVTSGNQSVTKVCSNGVTVYDNQYNQYPYNYYYTPSTYYNTTGLNINCYADPSSAKVSQPVTWTAKVTGGYAPYSYSWTVWHSTINY